jgi:cytochrome c-type biogenesis protein
MPALDVLKHGSLLALPLALAAGVITGLNPCCVALYPAATATWCACNSGTENRGLRVSFGFVLGMATATTILGVFAALMGRVVGQLGSGVRYAIAAVPLVMGLHLLGWLRFPVGFLPHRDMRGGWLGAFGTGLLLSLALTPCGTPVLASLLSYVAYKGGVAYGATMLFFYGCGSAAPVLLVGAAAGRLNARLERAGYDLWSEHLSGAAMLALGLFLIWRA